MLSRTPCKLAYVKACKCWPLQPYTNLNPSDPNGENVKGSLDSISIIGKDGLALKDDFYDFGEVKVSSDGLLHPPNASESFS